NHCPPLARLRTSAQVEDSLVECRLPAAVHACPVRSLIRARLPDVEDQRITGRDHPGEARADLGDEFGASVGGDVRERFGDDSVGRQTVENRTGEAGGAREVRVDVQDRKCTRLNSSHVSISYAVFCLRKNKHTFPSIFFGHHGAKARDVDAELMEAAADATADCTKVDEMQTT